MYYVDLMLKLVIICFYIVDFSPISHHVRRYLDITSFPGTLVDLWTIWRKSCIPKAVQIEWDLYVMAIVWCIQHEHDNKFFLPDQRIA